MNAGEQAESIRLDVHTHLIPVDHIAAFEGIHWDAAGEKLTLDGHVIGIKDLFRPQALLRWMDAQRIEKAFISAPPPVYRPHLDEATTAGWSAAINEGLAAIAATHPDRWAPLFHLPVEHPALCADIVRKLGNRFSMATGSAGVTLSDAAYDPLWTALDAAKAFVLLHPGEGCDPRLDPYYLHNLYGNPVETGLAVGHLIFGGVPERYPAIRFCLAHAGGAVGTVAGRWQKGYETARPGLDTAREKPADSVRRFCVDCIAHDPAVLELAKSVFGPERIVFGSDWPFPMGLLEPHRELAKLDAGLRRRIFHGKA